MTSEALAKRADWIDSPRRNHGRTAYRKVKHADVNEWITERNKAYYEAERRIRERIMELEQAMAAYQAMVKKPAEAAETTKELRKPHRIGVVHRLRLYAGMALLGAVVFGLAFTWTNHRDMAQAVGSILAVAIYAVFSRRQRKHSVE